VVVVLDREGLEAALPDMAAGAVAAVIATGVGGEQPLHPAPEVAIGLGAAAPGENGWA